MSIVLPCIPFFFSNTYVFRIFILLFVFGLLFSLLNLSKGKRRFK